MTTLAELVAATPAATRGIPTQLSSGSGVWRWVLELADPAAGTAVEWYDITELCVGVEINRGADEYAGRYRASVVELELLAGADELAPWNEDTSATFGTHVSLGAGLLVRGGLIRVTGGTVASWHPRFTGRVETWPDATFARGQIRRHQVTARDVSVELVNAPVASDLECGWYERAEHVLSEAGWSFGHTLYGAVLDAGMVPVLTEPDRPESASAIVELDAALDPAGVTWYTDRTGKLIGRPLPGDTFHAAEFGAGATGTPYVDPAPVVFSYNAELDVGVGYVVDDNEGRPFGIDDTELAIINHVRVSDPDDPTPYDTDDPVSIERYGRRTRSLSWVVANDTVADDIVDRLAGASKQATPLQTTADLPGFFPAMSTLDYLRPATILYTTGAGRTVVTATGRVRQLTEKIAPRGTAGIDWRITCTVDVDATDTAAELLPVTGLAVTSVDHTDALFGWANPSQAIAPTETWVRIPGQSLIWLELDYPMTALAWLGLAPDTAYSFDVRLVRRVDGLVTNVSPVRSVAFTTDPSPAAVVDTDGDGGLDIEMPDVDECVVEWVLESTADGVTWEEVTSGTAASGEEVNIDSSVLEDGLTYRVATTENCDDVLGATYYSPIVVPTCQTSTALGSDPYTRTDLVAYIPEVCAPDVVVEAVSGLAGAHGTAWGGVLSIDADRFGLASDTGAGGIIAYGATPLLDFTGAVTMQVKASVQTVESSRLFSIAGMRISAVAGTTGWYPSAQVTTLFGEDITITDTTERPLITPLTVTAQYDDDTGTLELFVAGVSVGDITAEDAAPRAAQGTGWYLAAPAASWVADAGVWSSVFAITPGVVAGQVVGTVAVGAGAVDVIVDGNYAYVACHLNNTLYVVDISDVGDPVVTDSLKVGAGSTGLFAVAKVGDYIVCVDSVSSGKLTAVDVSDPADISVSSTLTNTVFNGNHNIKATGSTIYSTQIATGNRLNKSTISGGTLTYVSSLKDDTRLLGARGLDITNGTHAYVGGFTGGRFGIAAIPGMTGIGHVTGLSNCLSPVRIPGTSYVAVTYSGGIAIINVATPASPSVATTLGGMGLGWLYLDPDDDNTLWNAVGSSIYRIDVTTPTSPSIIDTLDVGFFGTSATRLAVLTDYIVAVDYSAGELAILAKEDAE